MIYQPNQAPIFAETKQAPPRPSKATAPVWRKTKQERVDGKIEQMLETYKLMDELQRRKDEIGLEKHRAYLAQKYFPTEDEEEEGEGDIENMEELIKDDDSESVYESAQNSNN